MFVPASHQARPGARSQPRASTERAPRISPAPCAGDGTPYRGIAFWPNFSSRRCASSFVRPFCGSISVPLADFGGEALFGGRRGCHYSPSPLSPGTSCISSHAFSYTCPCLLAKRHRPRIEQCPRFGEAKNPIHQQFHVAIHEEPSQSIAPQQQRLTPAEGRSRDPLRQVIRGVAPAPFHAFNVFSRRSDDPFAEGVSDLYTSPKTAAETGLPHHAGARYCRSNAIQFARSAF